MRTCSVLSCSRSRSERSRCSRPGRGQERTSISRSSVHIPILQSNGFRGRSPQDKFGHGGPSVKTVGHVIGTWNGRRYKRTPLYGAAGKFRCRPQGQHTHGRRKRKRRIQGHLWHSLPGGKGRGEGAHSGPSTSCSRHRRVRFCVAKWIGQRQQRRGQ